MPRGVTENLGATLKQAERYSLIALSSAVAFFALSLPNPTAGDVQWTLLGVPLSVSPQLALVVLYVVYFGCCVLADNMLIHIRDLAKNLSGEQVGAALSYPTIITVSPIGRFFGTILPAGLMILSLAKLHVQNVYELPDVIWFVSYGFALAGAVVYLRVRLIVIPNLNWEKERDR